MATEEITADMIAQAIIAAEQAGESGEADQLRAVLAEKFPNWTPQLRSEAPYQYSDEQLAKNAENQAVIRSMENQEILDRQVPGVPTLASYASGFMFAGEHLDEIASGGDEGKKEELRQVQRAFGEEYPKTNIALRMAGGITSAIPLGSLAMTQKMYKYIQGLPWFWRYTSSGLTGGAIGGVEGTISGTGIQGEGQTGGYQTRLENAMDRGIAGTIWGIGGGLGGQGITDTASVIWTRLKHSLKDQSIAQIKELFGLKTNQAAEVIKKSIQDASAPLSVLINRLSKGGSQAQLADADQAMASVLDVINVSGGPGASVITEKVLGRAKTVAMGVDQSLDRNIEKLPYIKGTTQKEIKSGDAIKMDAHDLAIASAQKTAGARSKAYQNAYDQKINYAGADGQAIEEVLSKIHVSVRQAAMKRANIALQAENKELGQQSFEVGKDGILIWTNKPNMVQLDYLKRALGELGYNLSNVQKSMTQFVEHSDARLYRGLYTQLNNVLKNVNKPRGADGKVTGRSAYEKAVHLGQDNITRRNALQVGANLLDDTLNVNQLKRMMKNAGEAELEMARYGLRGSIEDTLGNVKKSINSPDIDLNQMNTLLKMLSSDNSRRKVIELLGKTKAKSVFKMLDMAEVALTLRASIAKGSQTAQRTKALETMKEATESGVLTKTLDVRPLEASRELTQKILQSKQITGKRKNLIMKEIANAMLGTKGATVKAQYRKLYDAVKAGEATEDMMLQIAELISSRLTITPINFTTQLMEDTDIEERAVLGISNYLQR